MTSKELRERWNQNSILKSDWDAIIRSEAWKVVSRMVELEEIERAETHDRMEGDPVLARNLSAMKGARRVLAALESASAPVIEPDMNLEEFAHIEPKQP